MDLLFFFLVLGLFSTLICRGACHNQVLPSSSGRLTATASNGSLEALLCNGTLQPSTVITLEYNVTYTVSPNRFCVVENLTSLVIRSSDYEIQAVVQCLTGNADSRVTSGFGFVNTRSITLENILIKNCGGVITPAAVRGINDSYFYFGPGQSTVFLFSQCFDLQLENVTITNYTGYGVISVNAFSQERGIVQITNVTVSNSTYYETFPLPTNCVHTSDWSRKYQCAGSGMLFYYTDKDQHIGWFPPGNTLEITGCTFAYNYNYFPTEPAIVTAVNNPAVKHLPLQGGGALSVIFTQHTTMVTTNISNSNFKLSGGSAYGATLVLHLNTPSLGLAFFSECIFQGGFSHARKYSGGDIVVYYNFSSAFEILNSTSTVQCLQIDHTRFLEGSKQFAQRHAHVALVQLSETPERCDVTIIDSHCSGDSPHTVATYGCIFAFALGSSNTLSLRMIDVSSNVSYGAFKFVNLERVEITGKNQNMSIFERGTTSLIDAYNTNVYLSGNITFRNNHAQYGSGGGAILLEASSYLYLQEPLNLVFENNSAEYGGAIYAVESNDPFCVFQFVTMGTVKCKENCSRPLDINVTFIGNTAQLAGNSIFAEPIYECDLILTSNLTVDQKHLPDLYEQIFHFSNKTRSEMSSPANQICVCDSSKNGYQCNITKKDFPNVRVFLGQVFSVWMQPIDSNNNPVSAIVSSFPTQQGWELLHIQEISQLFGTSCAKINFTILRRGTTSANGSISIQPIGSRTSNPKDSPTTYLNFSFAPCPVGYTENEDSGECECIAMLLHHNVHCDTSTGLMRIPENSWVGPVGSYPYKVGFSKTCLEGYCDLNTDFVNASDATDVCVHKRTGVLCGRCPDHLSVVFGSTKCQSCSNFWLLTIPLYALAGLFLVVSLFTLRLTVANGSLNGLIFYGNILSTSMLIFLDYKPLYWLLNFMATINLDLGFPVCFYQGMNDISKAYFQFVFPVYLWSLAGMVIFVSKYSVRISRLVSRSSVPVLCTVIHISFSKLTRAAFEGLSSADVEVENVNGTTKQMVVWYFDGSVRYCGGEHIGLFLLSLAILLFFTLPYTFILVIAPFLIRFKFVNYFKPLIDAYTGPYKDQRRFWFGLRVFILFLIFSLYEILKGRNNTLLLYLEALILAVLILAQVLAKPYRRRSVHILDLFFLIDCFLLTSYGAFLHTSTKSGAIYIGAGILVGLVFLVFSCVVVYHIWQAVSSCCRTENYRERTTTTLITSSVNVFRDRADTADSDSTTESTGIISGSNNAFRRYDMLREPLLEDN